MKKKVNWFLLSLVLISLILYISGQVNDRKNLKEAACVLMLPADGICISDGLKRNKERDNQKKEKENKINWFLLLLVLISVILYISGQVNDRENLKETARVLMLPVTGICINDSIRADNERKKEKKEKEEREYRQAK